MDPTKVPAVILCNPKFDHNICGIIRACSCFAIPTLMWTGRRIHTPTGVTESEGYADVFWSQDDRPFDALPPRTHVIGVELVHGAEPLTHFDHYLLDGPGYNSSRVAYVFGPEDGAIPAHMKRQCHRFVYIPAHHYLNLASAVNVVLADRTMKLQRAGVSPVLPVDQMLHQLKGYLDAPAPALELVGWNGK